MNTTLTFCRSKITLNTRNLHLNIIPKTVHSTKRATLYIYIYIYVCVCVCVCVCVKLYFLNYSSEKRNDK